jgi:hypothetical protein
MFEICVKEVDDVSGNRQRGLIAHRHDPVPIMPVLEGMMVVIWNDQCLIKTGRNSAVLKSACQIANLGDRHGLSVTVKCENGFNVRRRGFNLTHNRELSLLGSNTGISVILNFWTNAS